MTNANENKPVRTPNNVLMDAVDKLDFVVVLGLDKNQDLLIDTNRPTYEFVQYMLARASYKTAQLEDDNLIQRKQAQMVAAENAVIDKVTENMEAEVAVAKRGRKKKVL